MTKTPTLRSPISIRMLMDEEKRQLAEVLHHPRPKGSKSAASICLLPREVFTPSTLPTRHKTFIIRGVWKYVGRKKWTLLNRCLAAYEKRSGSPILLGEWEPRHG